MSFVHSSYIICVQIFDLQKCKDFSHKMWRNERDRKCMKYIINIRPPSIDGIKVYKRVFFNSVYNVFFNCCLTMKMISKKAIFRRLIYGHKMQILLFYLLIFHFRLSLFLCMHLTFIIIFSKFYYFMFFITFIFWLINNYH